MWVLVCGGRDYDDYAHIVHKLDKLHAEHHFTVLVHGDAGKYKRLPSGRIQAYKGADALAGRWAELRGVPQIKFPANWSGLDKAAGTARNKFMLDFACPDLVIAFPGGPGTANMMWIASKAGVEVIDVEEP